MASPTVATHPRRQPSVGRDVHALRQSARLRVDQPDGVELVRVGEQAASDGADVGDRHRLCSVCSPECDSPVEGP